MNRMKDLPYSYRRNSRQIAFRPEYPMGGVDM